MDSYCLASTLRGSVGGLSVQSGAVKYNSCICSVCNIKCYEQLNLANSCAFTPYQYYLHLSSISWFLSFPWYFWIIGKGNISLKHHKYKCLFCTMLFNDLTHLLNRNLKSCNHYAYLLSILHNSLSRYHLFLSQSPTLKRGGALKEKLLLYLMYPPPSLQKTYFSIQTCDSFWNPRRLWLPAGHRFSSLL